MHAVCSISQIKRIQNHIKAGPVGHVTYTIDFLATKNNQFGNKHS